MIRPAPRSEDPLAGLQLLALDFETYWAKDYTLRTIPTSLYVRDKRFKAQCLSVMHDGNKYPHILFGNDIKSFLQDRVDWSKTAVVAHHAHFDGLILSHHYGVHPAFFVDTLSMARALHGAYVRSDLDTVLRLYGYDGKLGDVLKFTKGVRDLDPVLASLLGDYCRGDTMRLLAIAKKMMAQFPANELQKIDIFVKMFTDPVLRVDREKAKAELKKERASRTRKVNKAGVEPEQLRSREAFADILRERGIKPPTKVSKRTGEVTYAFAKTDKGLITLLAEADEDIRELIEAKLALSSTIDVTRADALVARSEGNLPLPIYLNYAKAHTLRTTGGDKFNPQNFPSRNGDQLRQCIKAPPGYEIMTVDSGQIECRLNAWQAGQKDLLDAFRQKRDVYAEMATEIYGYPVDKKKHPKERFLGKTVVLAAGYQLSGPRLQINLATGVGGVEPVFLELDLCNAGIAAFRRKNSFIVAGWKKFDNLIKHLAQGRGEIEHAGTIFRRGEIVMHNGLTLKYGGLHMTDDGWKYTSPKGTKTLYGAKLVENWVQSVAYNLVSDQMLELAKYMRVVMFEHDANTMLVRVKDVDKMLKLSEKVMLEPPKWAPDLPLAVDMQHGPRYMK
jgi:DNA polymerase